MDNMKRLVVSTFAGLLLVGCAKQENQNVGSSPNLDTGIAQQNTVTKASPDTPAGAGAAASNGPGTGATQGAAVNQSRAIDTNSLGKPQHPPAR
jgi:hypothetical protein